MSIERKCPKCNAVMESYIEAASGGRSRLGCPHCDAVKKNHVKYAAAKAATIDLGAKSKADLFHQLVMWFDGNSADLAKKLGNKAKREDSCKWELTQNNAHSRPALISPRKNKFNAITRFATTSLPTYRRDFDVKPARFRLTFTFPNHEPWVFETETAEGLDDWGRQCEHKVCCDLGHPEWSALNTGTRK